MNEEYEQKNLELKTKLEQLESDCKTVPEDVLTIKTEEEELRTEFQIYKRKILYALSRVDLSLVGIKPNLKDFDKLIDSLTCVFRKQKSGSELVLAQIQKAMSEADL